VRIVWLGGSPPSNPYSGWKEVPVPPPRGWNGPIGRVDSGLEVWGRILDLLYEGGERAVTFTCWAGGAWMYAGRFYADETIEQLEERVQFAWEDTLRRAEMYEGDEEATGLPFPL
jgi:hypothetical protein